MKWILMFMISLCWLEVDAIRGLNSSECRRNIFKDWHNKIYRPYALQEAEKAYLQGTAGLALRADAPPGRRQECRTMSSAKLARLLDAFVWLFTTPAISGGLTRYQVFVSQHRFVVAPGAHFGPCFPPWHREYLSR